MYSFSNLVFVGFSALLDTFNVCETKAPPALASASASALGLNNTFLHKNCYRKTADVRSAVLQNGGGSGA